MPRIIIFLAAIFAALGVATGAFGAHALRARLGPDMLAVWQTAVHYHLVHALALLAVGALARGGSNAWAVPVASCFIAGMILFCGSLYLLAGLQWRAVGALTPIGGAMWLVGWAILAAAAWQKSF